MELPLIEAAWAVAPSGPLRRVADSEAAHRRMTTTMMRHASFEALQAALKSDAQYASTAARHTTDSAFLAWAWTADKRVSVREGVAANAHLDQETRIRIAGDIADMEPGSTRERLAVALASTITTAEAAYASWIHEHDLWKTCAPQLTERTRATSFLAEAFNAADVDWTVELARPAARAAFPMVFRAVATGGNQTEASPLLIDMVLRFPQGVDDVLFEACLSEAARNYRFARDLLTHSSMLKLWRRTCSSRLMRLAAETGSTAAGHIPAPVLRDIDFASDQHRDRLMKTVVLRGLDRLTMREILPCLTRVVDMLGSDAARLQISRGAIAELLADPQASVALARHSTRSIMTRGRSQNHPVWVRLFTHASDEQAIEMVELLCAHQRGGFHDRVLNPSGANAGRIATLLESHGHRMPARFVADIAARLIIDGHAASHPGPAATRIMWTAAFDLENTDGGVAAMAVSRLPAESVPTFDGLREQVISCLDGLADAPGLEPEYTRFRLKAAAAVVGASSDREFRRRCLSRLATLSAPLFITYADADELREHLAPSPELDNSISAALVAALPVIDGDWDPALLDDKARALLDLVSSTAAVSNGGRQASVTRFILARLAEQDVTEEQWRTILALLPEWPSSVSHLLSAARHAS